MNNRKSYKRKVKRIYPESFCVLLNNKSGFIVWPGKARGRGFEQPAIGLGNTAKQAWASVKLSSPPIAT